MVLSMITKKPVFGLVAVVVFCLICCHGCGRRNYDGPTRAAVAGAVAVDGVPVEGGIINLVPLSSEGSRKASAPINKGRYDIPEEKGPNLGDCLVEIRWLKPTGRKLQNQGNLADGLVDEMVEAVPEKYNTKTTLHVDIAAGKNNHDFVLSSK